jgi:hypothetical protein
VPTVEWDLKIQFIEIDGFNIKIHCLRARSMQLAVNSASVKVGSLLDGFAPRFQVYWTYARSPDGGTASTLLHGMSELLPRWHQPAHLFRTIKTTCCCSGKVKRAAFGSGRPAPLYPGQGSSSMIRSSASVSCPSQCHERPGLRTYWLRKSNFIFLSLSFTLFNTNRFGWDFLNNHGVR